MREEKWWQRPMTHFVVLTVSGLLLVGFGAVWASDRAGHREALNEARSITRASLRTVILPNLTDQVLSGHPAAMADFDKDIREHLLDDSIVRVKLWHPDGTVAYSDATTLIGERHAIDEHRLTSLERAVVVADHGDLGDPENRFEVDLGPLLEVYLPFEGPTQTPMLLEVYFTNASVNESARRIRRSVVPIIMLSLTAVGLLTLLLANHLQRRLDRAAREREQLLRRSVDASAIERRRIAAELHDGVVQELSGTLMLISAAESQTDDDTTSGTRIRQATAGLRQSLRSLRAVALDIHPPNLDDVGLRVALDELVETFNQRHDFTVTLSIGSGDFPHRRLIYRFVQEGLRNVAKHTQATSVQVTVEDRSDEVVVSVVDDGQGLGTPGEPGGMGIALLRGLAADVDGRVTFGPNRDRGSILEMTVPNG